MDDEQKTLLKEILDGLLMQVQEVGHDFSTDLTAIENAIKATKEQI